MKLMSKMKGFTTTELLIAICIVAVAFLIGFGIYGGIHFMVKYW